MPNSRVLFHSHGHRTIEQSARLYLIPQSAMIHSYDYVVNNKIRRQSTKCLLKDWKSQIPFGPNEAVLDVGCGPGDITSTVLRDFVGSDARIVGCDVPKCTIEYAKANFADDLTTFTMMDIGSANIWTDWKEKEFDKIFSFYYLHWTRNPKQAVLNMNRLLKPRGFMALAIVGCIPTVACNEFISAHSKQKDLKQMKGYTNDDSLKIEYENLIKRCGFQVLSCKTIETYSVYSTVEECIESCLSLAFNQQNLPPNTLPGSTEEFQEFLFKKGIVKKTSRGDAMKKTSQLEILAIKE